MKISYEPISAKDSLKEIRDLCSVMVDLAYSSIIFEDKELAIEVGELRDLVIRLNYLLVMSLSIGTRTKEAAEAALPLVMLAQTSKEIANSSTDIAHVIVKGFNIHQVLKDLATQVARDLLQGEISEESQLSKCTIRQAIENLDYSISIFGIRRGGRWTIMPDLETQLQPGDIILARGSSSGIDVLKMLLGGSLEEIPVVAEEDEHGEQKFEDSIITNLIALKDTSEVMVDLIYGAVLYNNKELAQLVSNMEKRVDTIRNKSELAVLRRAKTATEDLSALQGIMRVVEATEDISDSANEIAKIVLAGLPTHPIIEMVIEESAESIFQKTVEDASSILGKTIPAGNYLGEYGIRVLAIKRAGGHFFKPRRRTKIRVGDVIIFTGTKEACEAFQQREEQAVEEKTAELEAKKEEAERAVDQVAKKVSEEAADEAAKVASKKASEEIATAIAEKAKDKVTKKAASEVAEEVAEQVTKKVAREAKTTVVSEAVDEAVASVRAEKPDLSESDTKKAIQEAVEEAAQKTVDNAKEKMKKAAEAAATDSINEEADKVVKEAKKAAAETAAKEVEPVVKEAVKADIERAAKKAATEAIKEQVSVEKEPQEVLTDAAKEAAKETAGKSAERVVERTGKKVASKAAEEAAEEAAEKEAKKVAKKAAKKAAEKTAEEVLEKEVKEVAKKAAKKAAEKVAKKSKK